jgi:hypothetical protein
MMMTMSEPWIVVLTTPGRVDYRTETLASLDASGAKKFKGRKVVFCDGTDATFDVPEGWEACPMMKALSGTTVATLTALRRAYEGGASDVLFFEDDVRACKNAVALMEAVAVSDDLGFLVFSDIRGFSVAEPSLRRLPGAGPDGRGHWGNQALKISADALRYLQSAPIFFVDKASASDVVLGHMLASPPSPWKEYGVCSPSIFEHVGERSEALPGIPFSGPGRATHNFAGIDYDAMSLLSTINNVFTPVEHQ